jgi:peptidoglycan/LPS O-acetylase OafA/YrhL
MQVQIQEINQIRTPTGTFIPDFIPAIDGLRGIAILGVIFFHLGLPFFNLGWAGVELFFVISGFLITRILLNTRREENYFKRFYIRRTLRIFPIYYVVLLLYTAVMIISASNEFHALPFYYVYLQTIPQLKTEFRIMPMLSHTWTLAIEEQFYLIWPLAVLLLRGKKLLIVSAVLIATALGLRFISLKYANPFLVDGWIGVQLDVLVAGALLAYAASQTTNRNHFARVVSTVFVIGTVGLMVLITILGPSAFWTPKIWGRTWPGPLVISAMACCFFGLVGFTAIGHPWTRWLEFKPLRRWGKISYGIYLYHPYILRFVNETAAHLHLGKNRLISISLLLTKLGLVYLTAWISWQLIEKPILQLKGRLAP